MSGGTAPGRGPVPLVADLAAGTLVGEYRVEAKVGEGGMGVIYAARHPLIGKRAAVKVIARHLSGDSGAVERFVQEARTVSQLGHPNIVDAFSFGRMDDGRSYFIMEWLQGEDLASRLTRGGLTVGDASEILVQVCRALEAAHGRGVVHRDLKPHNVFLVEVTGQASPLVKLLDFGVAKLVGVAPEASALTRSGALIGTPFYLAPEQARGDAVEPRTDIYALGVLAYQVLLGRLPFDDVSLAAVLGQHLYVAPVAPRKVWPEVPPELSSLLLAMLAKAPGQRPSAAEVRAALEPFRGSTRALPGGPPVRGGACLSETAVLALLGRELNADARATAEAHIDGCDDCRQVVAALARSHPSASAAPTTATAAARRRFRWPWLAAPLLVLVAAIWALAGGWFWPSRSAPAVPAPTSATPAAVLPSIPAPAPALSPTPALAPTSSTSTRPSPSRRPVAARRPASPTAAAAAPPAPANPSPSTSARPRSPDDMVDPFPRPR